MLFASGFKILILPAVRGFLETEVSATVADPSLGAQGRRTTDPSQVGTPFPQAEISLLKQSVDDLSQYRSIPRSTSRSGSRGRSGRSRGREEGREYPWLSKLRSGDREILQRERAAEIAAVNLKYRLMDRHRQ